MANLSITETCNRSCSFCFAANSMKSAAPGSAMSVEQFEQGLDLLQRSGIREAPLLGGEPTIHPQFAELVDRVLARGMRLLLLSGGLIPNTALDRLARIAADDVLVMINVAMPGESTAAEVRRQREVFERLRQRAMPGLNIHSPAPDLDYLIELIEQHGLARSVRLGLTHPILEGGNVFLHTRYFDEVGRRVAEFAFRAREREITIEFDCGWVPCMFPEGALRELGIAPQQVGLRCNPILDVLPDGQVISCYPLGDFHRERMLPADDVISLRRRFNEKLAPLRPLGIFRKCAGCDFRARGECVGGCLSTAMRRLQQREFQISAPGGTGQSAAGALTGGLPSTVGGHGAGLPIASAGALTGGLPSTAASEGAGLPIASAGEGTGGTLVRSAVPAQIAQGNAGRRSRISLTVIGPEPGNIDRNAAVPAVLGALGFESLKIKANSGEVVPGTGGTPVSRHGSDTSSNRWSLPYIDQPIGFWDELQEDHGPFIADVYFPLPGGIIGSGRPPLPDAHVDSFLRRCGLRKSVLLNAVTLPQPVDDIAPAIIEALRRLNGEFGICRATIANLQLAARIRSAMPDWSLTASVLMEIGDAFQARLLNGLCDTLVPASRVVRDMPALKSIRAAYHGHIRLLVNEACLPGCPYRTQHFHEMASGVPEPKSLCAELLHEQAWLRLIGSWVLPQHLHLYDGVYDELKLAGRVTLQDPARFRHVFESYLRRRPLQPHEIGGGPSSVVTPMHIGEEFFAYTLECGRRCHECTRCPDYYAAALAERKAQGKSASVGIHEGVAEPTWS
jgi:MoaA/NifB/PqqE/SkfB family radical SAM enzyme